MILKILTLATICVLIIDLSGFTQSWKSGLKKLITKGKMSDPNYTLKPFDCSLCMTFWSGVTYLLCSTGLNLYGLVVVLTTAFLTPVIADFLILVRDGLISILDLIRGWFSVR